MLPEYDHETATTRLLLERAPESKASWKPHEKSMTLGQLARHVTLIPGGVASGVEQLTMQVPNFPQPTVEHVRELIPLLDESVAKAHAILGNMSDDDMRATWRLVNGDQTIMAMPRMAFLRAIMLNHWYHHRGQLSVYLRQLGVPLPSIYGPSADENPFATPAAAATA
jgi:uncharacterized damage-inducible protein DinB